MGPRTDPATDGTSSLIESLLLRARRAMLYRMVNNLDSVYTALSDPTRRRMLERLRLGPLSVSDLAEPRTMTLAAFGKHVTMLEAAGIIRTTKVGRVRTCALEPRSLSAASQWLVDQEAFWNDSLDSLATHLEENP